MKRPMLVSGSAIGLSSAFLVFSGIRALPFLLLGAVSVFIIYFIKPLNLRDKIIIPTICISVFFSCLFFGIYHSTKISPASKLDNTVTDISGKIITTPQETAYGTNFILKTDKIGNQDNSAEIQVYLTDSYDGDLKLYDYVSLPDTKLEIIRNEYNKPDASSISDNIILEVEAEDCNYLWDSERTPYYYCLRFKEIITEQIKAYLPEYNAGFLLGMLFGDKTALDTDIVNDFRATGIAHLLAVSGLHTSTWCAYIILLLKLFKVKEKLRNIFCLLFLILLCIVSAFTPSVMRASIMMAVILFAPFFNERQDPLNSLGFSVAVLTLHNPYIITSTSFLLSVSATLGVLFSLYFNHKLSHLLLNINNNSLRKITEYFSSSLLTTSFAGLFTLPFSAYFFGVFSIVSPLTNILCVKPAFWSLISGVIATAVSFIPQSLPQTIAIFIFKLSTLFADFVTGIANTLEKFSFCTLPVHKEYFLSCIIIITLILFFCFLFKASEKKRTKIIIISLCSVIFVFSIIFPCTDIAPATIYVTDVENGVNVTLRKGLKYAHFNCGASDDDVYLKSLPKAKCEALDFLFISDSDKITDELTEDLLYYSPKTTVITQSAKIGLNESNINLCSNTVVSDSFIYNFNNEINVQIVDTYPASCVIIKSKEKIIYISYGNNGDFNSLFEAYGKPDILILSEYLPDKLPTDVETIIISSSSEIILNENFTALKKQCKNFCTTAENGDIKIFM